MSVPAAPGMREGSHRTRLQVEVMGGKYLLIGQTLLCVSDPFRVAPSEAFIHNRGGGVLIENGTITAVGDADELRRSCGEATVHDHSGCLLLPGFIDAHVHYPQTAIIASWGERLLEWLSRYTFPEELKFRDPAHAAAVAELYLDLVLANGTTTVCSYCTTHPESVGAFFRAAESRNMRVAAGKVCMDRNAPDGLLDDPRSAYDQSSALLGEWHGRGRLSYVITPRFAVTSSREQLEALGSLWREHPDCLMQTHLSEQTEEVEEVSRLFPQSRDYLDVYESCGLLGPNGLYGHAIHLNARERARLKEVGAALIHCPTSNMFVGSGLFDLRGRVGERQRVGLATDTAGGSSFSMLRTMAAAYEIGQLNGTALHPGQLIWLATEGNARVLGMERHIGSLRVGAEADVVVLDLASTEAIAQRARRAEDIWEELFPTMMMGDDRAVKSVWVAGAEVSRTGSRN